MRPELALDLAPPSSGGFVPLKEAAALEEYVRRLEEERRKIEGFRRELPLCLLILNDTIEGVKEELAGCRGGGGGGGGPELEEFMPVNAKFEEAEGGVRDEKDFRDKVNWMSSAQLWSDNYSANTSSTTSTTVAPTTPAAATARRRAQRAAEDRSGGGGRAFLPFNAITGKEKAAAAALPPPDLSLLSPATKASSSGEHQRSGGSISISISRVSSRGTGMASPAGNEQPPPSHQAAPRKPRRCWSPELHRRFVKALQQLGGAQGSATPKQIRELMKVDGLTNDEVKSHLQKYRLHTRRLPSSSSPEKHPMVVLGGCGTGSPQGPLHLANAGEDSGEEEDGRSESYSWKGHLQRPAGEETD
ncbi:unnamed protein product [Spirodela intermedia]|uniref:HTH myb-type domain-containing protein n=1 Tax=Spirodela intermedia TaxID=51605 RepID=A0A7I8IKW6_SPIIN|nr:unnamed protein product [Spirodela intermedia]CAA6657782.1 unnamed protein product [Spirodela intermedia]